MTPQELEQQLHYFTGSSAYYPLYPQLKLTDGTKFLCEQAKCFWLMDIIWSYQTLDKIRKEPLQVYTLTVDLEKQQGLLVCSDGNENILHKQSIPYTDFPMESIKVYYIDQIALLPSEY